MFDTSNLPAGGTGTGILGDQDVSALQKALDAGYGTDVAQLTGGGALRIQSLDPVMQATITSQKNFKLFGKVAKTKPTATVDEWTEQSGIGGYLGSTTNSEAGSISLATGAYARRTGSVKYLMTRSEVTLVQAMQNTIVDSKAVEYQNAALRLLRDAEYLMFEGNEAVQPLEFSGIRAQMEAGVKAGQVAPGNIIDMRGDPLESMHAINQAQAQVAGIDNFGGATDVFWNLQVQQDMDNKLDPAFRVALNGGVESLRVGAPVIGIRTSAGEVAANFDMYIPRSQMRQPWDAQNPVVAAQLVALKPQSVTTAATTDASSQFDSTQAGNYYYAVAGLNASGQSGVVVASQTTVATGGKVTLTITRSSLQGETGYVIYRSRQGGGNSPTGNALTGSDFREIARVGVAGSTTTFIDMNENIPGTTEAYVLNMNPADTAITWRQFLPMFEFPLYTTDTPVIRWSQILCGYLRLTKRRQHAVIKNILPRSEVWKPFA